MADDDAGKGPGPSAGAKVQYDDIVANVHADPAKPQGATLISGYVGKSDTKGRVRIYPDISLGTYHEVAEADVVHSVPIPKETSPLGGSHVWVKGGAEIKPGSSAPAGAAVTQNVLLCPTMFAATCPVCPPSIGCAHPAAQAAAPIPPPPTQLGATCPNGDCTFFGGCYPTQHGMTCPRHICGETMAPTVHQYTCPRHICGETMVPTVHHLTCPRFICTETMPSGIQTIVCTQHLACVQQGQAQAAVAMPTPTATFFHTCGLRCPQNSGIETIVCTHHAGCQQNSGIETVVCTYHPACQQYAAAGPAAAAVAQHTFNPTQCTRCFICPPITAPQTRSGVFCPYG